MRVTLVCKAETQWHTVGKEYQFEFADHQGCTDGYVICDDGDRHWMMLPSNCHRYPDTTWRSSDYFTEVVHDPEN